MSNDLVLHYRLPLSRVVVSGVLRRSVDRALHPDADLADAAARLVSYSIEPRTAAEHTGRSVELGRSWLFATKNSFVLTPDGRLSSASVETTGQLGEVVAAAGQLLGAAVAVALGGSEPDPHFVAYGAACPDGAARISRLRQALATLGAALDTCYATAAEDTDPAASRAAPRIARLERLVDGLERRLAAAEAPFHAWQSQQIDTVDTSFAFVVELVDIGAAAPTQDPSPSDTFTPPVDLATLWSQYGVTVVARWQSPRGTSDWSPPNPTEKRAAARARRTLYARCADTVELDTVCFSRQVRTVTATTRAYVVDARSTHLAVPLARSLFGRRSVGVSFSPEGFLTGLSSEGDATLAKAAQTAAGLSGNVQAGLEGVGKIRTATAAARRSSIEGQLAATKAALELEQARTGLAGAQLTGQDAARLARLTQLKSIYESQVAITGADPELTAWARAQIELLGGLDEPGSLP